MIRCFIWGRNWRGSVVCCNCDNQAVVEVINSGSAKDAHLSHLLRCVHYAEATCQFKLVAHHVAGAGNDRADDLSRGRLSSFLSKVPSAVDHPTPIPTELLWLAGQRVDWTSEDWSKWSTDFFERHWHHPQDKRTRQPKEDTWSFAERQREGRYP